MSPIAIISESFKTPFGQLTILVNESKPNTVVGSAFGKPYALISRVKVTRPTLSITTGKLPTRIKTAVEHWLDGNHLAFADIMVDQVGTEFRQECWTAMRQIKPGQTISYSQLAQKTTSPTAVRAAATACAQNLIAPLIPCHRIIKTDGSVGRYGYGEALKRQLLAFEGVSL